MAFNGNGTYTLPSGNPVVTGTVISSVTFNGTMQDIATALSNCVTRDGQSPVANNLPMGGFKITGLGAGTASTDGVNLSQSQSSASQLIESISGTDTITGILTPAITAYAVGQSFRFISAGANTGAVTININGLGAKSITKFGSTALSAGDIPSGSVVEVVYDGTRFAMVNLVAQQANTATTAETANSLNTANNYQVTNLTYTGTLIGSTNVINIGSGQLYKDASGNVGIGTSLPIAPLDVHGASGLLGQFHETTSGNNRRIRFSNSGAINTIESTAGSGSTSLAFAVDGAERMRIGSAGNILVNQTTSDTGAKLSVTGGIKGTITSGTAVATTSGTAIDFTGIPSWVKRITVMLNGVSTNSTSPLQIQIGSGSIDATSYVGTNAVIGIASAASATMSSGFLMTINTSYNSAADVRSGSLTLVNLGSNIWIVNGLINAFGYPYSFLFSGAKTLSGVLDRLRLTTVNGTDAFDAGSVNILYEG